MTRRFAGPLLSILLLAAGRALAAEPPPPATLASADPVARIVDEGLHRSAVMATATYLTEAIGPRLTNSPGFRRAAIWTRDTLASWGLANARLEPWRFGRGWSLVRFSAQVLEPQAIPLIAYPKAWSPGTEGELVADAVWLEAKSEADLAKYRGTLHGKIVLVSPVRQLAPPLAALATRWSDAEMLKAADGEPFPPNNDNFAPPPAAEAVAAAKLAAAALRFANEEGAGVIVTASPYADGGTVEVQSASVPQPLETPPQKRIEPWDAGAPPIRPQIVVAVEPYNRIVRMLHYGQPVRLAVDLRVRFDDDVMSSHTLAEIPGSDLAGEVVMLGAHLDSWHAGTGATDDGAGVAVVMEAVRILQALQLRPRRTIRIALWGGEEVADGARSYVDEHLAAWVPSATEKDEKGRPKRTLATRPEYEKISGYFNIDAGSGRIRGVYLAGNEALRPIFRPWLEPFRGMGATTLTPNGDWGSDFLWFDRVGIPIVSFIQDDLDYDSRAQHTNQDVLERLVPEDLKQASVIMAAFVYQAAMRDEKLPRKPVR
jgi:carboxypeptidase Q